MYDTDTIRANNDLSVIAEMAGARFHRAGGELRSHCPIHGGDNSSGFAIYDNGTRWACFTRDCGSGDVIDFVMKWRGCDFNAACEWLGADKHIEPAEAARIAAERVQKQIERLEEEHQRTEQLLSELRATQTWLKYHETLEENQKYRAIWESQGIPADWQNYWQLGYCPSFAAMTASGLWRTPTLTIPIFTGEYELQNIRHRLLNPPAPKDKYRPERPGLEAIPFYADPQMMYDNDRILYVEGEKKAMVTYLTLDSPKWQVIGLPGKAQWKREVEKLGKLHPFIWLDPDALSDAHDFARAVHGYVIDAPIKVDDAIVEGVLSKGDIRNFIKGATKA